MRADVRALIAADTLFGIPYGNIDRRAALLVSRAADRERAVDHFLSELRNLEAVAFLTVHDILNARDERRNLMCLFLLVLGIRPVRRNIDAMQSLDALVDGAVVHVDNLLTLLAVRCDDSILEVLDSRLDRNDVRELEERGLHDHVEATAEAELLGDFHSVDRVELDVVLRDVALHVGGQVLREILLAPDRVEQEFAAALETCEEIVLRHIRLLRTRDEVRVVNEIRRIDRRLAEAQMRHRDAARLLRVVGEIRLRIHVGLVADDLDGTLVRADRAVRAKTPELAGRRAFRREIDVLGILSERRMRDIIVDGNREAVLRIVLLEFLVDREDMIGRRVLAAETIAAADDDRVHVGVVECRLDIEVERLADRARLLRAVEDGDLLDRLRQILEEMFERERTIEMHGKKADLFTLGIEIIHGFAGRLTDRAHGDDDALGILCTMIVEEMVLASRDLREICHGFLDKLRQRFIVLVGGFLRLEVDIRILRRTADDRMIRVQCACTELLDRIPVEEFRKIVKVDDFDLLNLMRRAETVEEVDERHAALDGDEMRDSGEIHDLLHARLTQHRTARLTRCHDIALIAENIEGGSRQSTGAHMEDTGKELAGNLVEVRDHQQEALRSRVRRRQGACLQRTVHSARCACLGLHLDDAHLLTEDVLRSLRRQSVDMLRHRRGRRDRVDGRNIGECVGNISRSRVAVHGLHFFAHVLNCSPLYKKIQNT